MNSLFIKVSIGVSTLLMMMINFDQTPIASRSVQKEVKIELPDNIKGIVEMKCIGCHKPDARNEKAKKKLQWVKVPEMNEEEQLDFIAEMFEVLEEGKMPPERTRERRPEMALTAEEKAAFISWIEEEEKKLKGQQ